MPAKRPNILFLMSDQHRPTVCGWEGDGVVRMPVLNELARTGVVFRNAYTPAPICIPGRQAIMAGQFPRTCKAEQFSHDLEPHYMTWARRLWQYGYDTVCAGKLHHCGADQMQGWSQRIAADTSVRPQAWGGRIETSEAQTEVGTGKWKYKKEIERAGIGEGRYQRFDQNVRDQTLQWIEDQMIDPFYDRPRAPAPLCLKVSLLQPHYPFYTSRERFNYYLNRVPIYQDQPLSEHPMLRVNQDGSFSEVTPRDIRRTTACYYGMIETIDGHYGDILQALRDAGQDLDDWIIVYTTDHGEMLGEHAIWEKSSFYEGSVRVPLIIRWPTRFRPRVVEENVNLCDLFATLCDLAGIPVPNGLNSRSLVPLMDGHAADWDDEVVSQLFGKRLMIKQGQLKYMDYGQAGVAEVLFDLATDPDELVNQIDNPHYAKPLTAFRARRDDLGFGARL